MPIVRHRPPPPSPIRLVSGTDDAKVLANIKGSRKAAERAAAETARRRAEQDAREADLPRLFDKDGRCTGILRVTPSRTNIGWIGPVPIDPTDALRAEIAALRQEVADLRSTATTKGTK